MAVVPFKRKTEKSGGNRRGRPTKAGKALSNAGALQHLRVLQAARGGSPIEVASIAELASMLRWKYPRTHKAVGRWRKGGQAKVEELVNGNLSIFVHPDRGALERGRGAGVSKSKAPRQTRRRNPGQMPPEDIAANLDKRIDKTAAEGMENTSAAATSTTSTKPGKSPSTSEGYFFSKSAEEQAGKPDLEADFPAGNTAATASKIPPPSQPSAATPDTSMESNLMGLFSRTKKAPEPAATPAVEATVLPSTVAAYPHQPTLPRYNFDGLPATYDTRMDWRSIRRGGEEGMAPREGEGTKPRGGMNFTAACAYLASFLMAAVSSGMAIFGLGVFFGGAYIAAIIMGVAFEAVKYCLLACMSRFSHVYHALMMVGFIFLVAATAALDVFGAYNFLAKAHSGYAVAGDVAASGKVAEADARLNVANGRLRDLSRQIELIDGVSVGAAQRGKAKTASQAIERERGNRASLVAERDKLSREIATLQVARSQAEGDRRIAETDTDTTRFFAEMIGRTDTDVARWFLLFVAAIVEPLALGMFVAASWARKA